MLANAMTSVEDDHKDYYFKDVIKHLSGAYFMVKQD